MSVLHKFKVESIGESGTYAKVSIDGSPIHCRGYEISHYVGEAPTVNIELLCMPQYEHDAVIKIENKEEIAALMEKSEFEEFCRIWEKIHDDDNIKFDICQTNTNCEENPCNCGYAIDCSTCEDVANAKRIYICGRDKCKYAK